MSVQLIQGKLEDLCHRIKAGEYGPIDLVFADPPDNLGLGYDGYTDDLPVNEYEALLENWLVQCCSFTSGPVFWTFNECWTYAVEQTIRKHDLKLIQRCYWHFTFGQNNKARYTPSVRPVYWLNSNRVYPDEIKVPSARQSVYGDKRAKAGGRMPDNLQPVEIDPEDPEWKFSRVCGTFKEKRRWHVCQMPEALLERVIRGHSRAGDTILDPFVGSGTTALVGDKLGRNVIGIDQSQLYLHKIAEELARRQSDQAA